MTQQLVPSSWVNVTEHLRKVGFAINQLFDGKHNAVGTITLTANQATTTLSDRRIGVDTVITVMPTTANASAEIGAGTMYISARGDGTATITHANNAQADRDFSYTLSG